MGRLWRALGQPGAPAGAGAWQWVQEQGATVTCICGLVVHADAERLQNLLTSLPALVSIGELEETSGLSLRPHPGAGVAATQDFLAGAARDVGCCSCLQDLDLDIDLADDLADPVPATFWRYLGKARALVDLELTIRSGAADPHGGQATTNVSQVLAGLASLLRLRTLSLELDNICEDTTLPACVSCLVRLTSLSLNGLGGLRCAYGWARLPALKCLKFTDCEFAVDGEDALPGMRALASLTEFMIYSCPGLHMLPASVWRLKGLRDLGDWRPHEDPPAAAPPACAPCYASLTDLCLVGHQLRDWPACALAMTSLTYLNLRDNCFERLPEGVSVLTALQWLCLGRHSTSLGEIGGALDARALGSLAGFPHLSSLQFWTCSVQLCPNFQAAAAHPCLNELKLITSYPACGPSCGAFLGLVVALLQQGRAGVLRLQDSVVRGAGQHDGQNFRGALQAVGFQLCDDDDDGDGADGEGEGEGESEADGDGDGEGDGENEGEGANVDADEQHIADAE